MAFPPTSSEDFVRILSTLRTYQATCPTTVSQWIWKTLRACPPRPSSPSHRSRPTEDSCLCHGHGLFFHGLMHTLYFCMGSRVLALQYSVTVDLSDIVLVAAGGVCLQQKRVMAARDWLELPRLALIRACVGLFCVSADASLSVPTSAVLSAPWESIARYFVSCISVLHTDQRDRC
jgi:hypothetical protein